MTKESQVVIFIYMSYLLTNKGLFIRHKSWVHENCDNFGGPSYYLVPLSIVEDIYNNQKRERQKYFNSMLDFVKENIQEIEGMVM